MLGTKCTVFGFVLMGVISLLCVSASGQHTFPTPQPPAVLSPDILPADVDVPDTLPHQENPIQFFDDYSWRIFIALNWPAANAPRGTADPMKQLGDLSSPRVWETWKAAFELFHADGSAPSAFETFDPTSPCPDAPLARPGTSDSFGAFSKFSAMFLDINQATASTLPGFPLVAQNHTYTRYQTNVNKVEYNFIVNGKFYLAENLPKPGSPNLVFPNGSIEIKSAWREVKPEEGQAALARFYHVHAKVLNLKTKKCEDKEMALVGLHIVQKTAKRPQWIWSTFEHVDNLRSAIPGVKPSYSDPQSAAAANIPPPLVDATHPPLDNPIPVQCVRLFDKTLPQETAAANEAYHKHAQIKDTVWANYQLIRTQWPTNPLNPDGTPTPGTGVPFPPKQVGNITMETYEQRSSCMTCHGNSQGALDTDFVFFLKVRAVTTSPEGVRNQAKNLAGLTTFLRSEADREPGR